MSNKYWGDRKILIENKPLLSRVEFRLNLLRQSITNELIIIISKNKLIMLKNEKLFESFA